MKRIIISIVLLLTVAAGRASVVTNFFADFSGSVDGSLTAIGLNNGTSVGAWTVTAAGDSVVSNEMIGFENQYDCRVQLDTVITSLSDTNLVTVSFDARAKDETPGGPYWNTIDIKNSGGNNVVTLRISNQGVLQGYFGGWVELADGLLSVSETPDELDHFTFVFGLTGLQVYVNSGLVSEKNYNNPGFAHSIYSLRISTGTSTSGLWFDNVSVTTAVPEPASISLIAISSASMLLIRRAIRH
ncbi:MAG: hypothetical protein AB7E95_05240 [Kiritimatiellales bacterium]